MVDESIKGGTMWMCIKLYKVPSTLTPLICLTCWFFVLQMEAHSLPWKKAQTTPIGKISTKVVSHQSALSKEPIQYPLIIILQLYDKERSIVYIVFRVFIHIPVVGGRRCRRHSRR